MRQQCKTVYQFDELSDSAKDRACDWFRQHIECDDWSECVIEQIVQAAQVLGIRINTRPVQLMNGNRRQEPVLYFDLGRNSGVSFDGWYYYAKGSAQTIKSEWPKDVTLQAIANDLRKVQQTAFYTLSARIDGHERSMSVSAEVERTDSQDVTVAQADIVETSLQEFASWAYGCLQAEYEYRTSDECIAENIRANEYEFTEDGRIS